MANKINPFKPTYDVTTDLNNASKRVLMYNNNKNIAPYKNVEEYNKAREANAVTNTIEKREKVKSEVESTKDGIKSNLGTVYNKLASKLDKNMPYTPVIQFFIGSDTTDEVFKIENNSKSSENIFVSLNHDMNGSGQANNFTLVIVYQPLSNSDDTEFVRKMNKIETSLCETTCPPCSFRYGLSFEDELIMTDEYEGRILDYSFDIQEGLLYYTITGYSGISLTQKDKKVDDAENDLQAVYENKKPTEVFEEAFNALIKENGYKLVFDSGVKGSDKVVKAISLNTEVSVFEYLLSILGYAESENDSETTEETERTVYTYSICDQKDNKCLFVYTYTYKELINKKPECKFYWMNNKNNFVINFTNQFKGSAAAALIAEKRNTSKDIVLLDEKGEEFVEKASSNSSPDSSNYDPLYAKSRVKSILYQYKASVTVIGIPATVKILDVIELNILLNGQKHHSSGNYAILKIQDTIDSSGYITTFDLIKCDESIVNHLVNADANGAGLSLDEVERYLLGRYKLYGKVTKDDVLAALKESEYDQARYAPEQAEQIAGAFMEKMISLEAKKAESGTSKQSAKNNETKKKKTNSSSSSSSSSGTSSYPKIKGPHSKHLTKRGGVFAGPSGKETYYNLPMDGVIKIMRNKGFSKKKFPYAVRSDGVKTLGGYVMVAANLQLHPRGTFVETSLGTAIVCDTGSFAEKNKKQLDIAVNW